MGAQKEFGAHRDTLKAKLIRNGEQPAKDDTYSTAQIVAAIFGDIESEKLRKVKEEADKLSLANRQTRGDLISVDDAIAIAQRFASAARQAIVMSKLSPEEKNAVLSELRGLAEVDWTKLDSYFDEED